MIRSLHVALIVAVASTLTSVALADVPRPNETDCASKTEGAACDYSPNPMSNAILPGTCQKSTCSNRVFVDGGFQETQVPCLVCTQRGADAGVADASADAASDAQPTGFVPNDSGSDAAPDRGISGDAGGEGEGEDSGGCSSTGTGTTFGPWLIALTVPFFLRKRSKGSKPSATKKGSSTSNGEG